MKPKYHNPFVSRSSSPALAALPSSVFRPLLALVISLGFGGNARAVSTVYWDTSTSSGYQVGNGDWGTFSDWTTNGTTLTTWASGDSAYFNGSGISSITVNSAVSAAAVHIGDAPGNGTNTTVFFSGTNTLTDTGYFGVGWEADVQNGTHSYTAYDTFVQTGGTINVTASGIIIGRFGTTASYYMSGGSLTTPNAVNSIRLGNASTSSANPGNSSGVFLIDGGTVSAGASGTILLGASGQSGSVGSGVLSLNSGSLTAGTLTLSAANTTYTTGTLDLNNTGSGSTLTLSQINTTATGTSTFNFNGGTLKPSGTSTAFMTGLTNAYIYAGGAVIDTSGATGANTISQNLLAAPGGGYGLAITALTPTPGSTGVGYKSAPTVTFGSPASGTDAATGYAVLNTDGTINKIVITNPGSGYSSSQAVTVTLSGGSPTTAATFANASASASQTSGGLTKNGTGTLILSGANNTYTGVTTLSNGTLTAANVQAFGTNTSAAALTLNGGTLDLAINSSVNAYNTTVGGTVTIASDKATASSAGITHTLGTLSIGANQLDVTAGGNVGSGTAGVAFGTTTLTAGPAVFDTAANTSLTLGAVGGGAYGLTKQGTGSMTLSGVNTYTGTTSISNGTLVLGASGSLASSSSLSLAASATFDPRTSGGTRSQTFANVALSGGTITVGMSSGNVDAITATGTTSVTGSNTFTLYGGANSGTYDLLSTAGMTGGGSFSLDTSHLSGAGFTSYTGAVSGNNYVLTVAGNPTPTTAYWLGGVSGTWNDAGSAPTSNWATDAGGTNAQQLPGSVSDVIFAATGSGNNSTTLGGDFTVKSLTFSSAGTFSVAGGNTLTVSGTNGNGNAVEIGDGTNATNVTLSMTGSSWTGATDIKANGTLTVGNSNAVGSASGALIVDGTLNVNNNLSKGDLSGGGSITRSVSGTGTLTVGTANSTTFGGIIGDGSGTLALTKQGTGTLTLSNSNTYSGLTTINQGTLILGATGDATNTPLGNTTGGTVVSATGAALDLNGFTLGTAEALTLSGTGVSGGGALTNSGALASYSGLITLGGATTISGGANGINLTNTGTITGATFGLTLDGASTASTLASMVGTGTGGVTKIGAGTWTLSGANTYTGVTTINGGTLSANTIADATGSSIGLNNTTAGALTFGSSNGTLNFTGTTGATTRAITFTGQGTFDIAGGSTLTVGATGAASATSGAWTGSGGVTKTGSGTLTIKDNSAQTTPADRTKNILINNNNGGTFTMQAGTLNLQPQGAAGSAHVIIGDATTGVFNQTGGTVDFAPANASANNFFYVGITNSGTLDITGGTFTADSTQSGGIQVARAAAGTVSIGGGAGTALVDTPLLNFGVSTAGTGTLNLYTNGTLLTSKISVTSGTNTANFDGGTLEAKSSTTTFLSGLTTAAITNNGLTVDTNGFNITIAQALSGVGGPTKRNSGTLTLSGANTYTGATTVANGTLSINTVGVSTNAQSLGKGGTLNLGVAGISSGILQYTGTGGTLDKAVNALGNGLDSIQNTGGGLLTLSGTITNNGTSITLGGTGAITVGGTITGTGTGNSNLIDADSLLTLSTADSYDGTTTVDAGSVLEITNGSALGGNGATVNSGGALELSGGITVGAEALSLSGTGIGNGGALRNVSGVNIYGGVITLLADSRINSDADSLTLTGGIGGAFNLTIGGAGGTVVNCAIAANTLTKDGAGTLTLSGTNTYTGATTISAGIVQISAASNLGDSTQATNTISLGAATLESTANSYDLGVNRAITLTGAGTIQSDGGTLTVSGAITNGTNLLTVTGAGNTTISGVIGSGSGGLTMSGAGILTLSGTNTYTGNTTVSAGTLALSGSGSIAESPLIAVAAGATLDVSGVTGGNWTVAASQTLSGSGTVNGTTTVGVSGTVHPGGANTLSTGPLTISGGTYECDINATTSDQLAVGGALTLSGAVLNMHALATPAASSYTIATYTSLSGTFTGLAEGASVTIGSATYIIKYADGGNNITLTPSVASGYSSWIAGYPGLSDSTPGGNPSGDGITNLMKYALNGNPSISDPGILPTQSEDGSGNLVFTYTRLHESTNDTTEIFEYSSDLVTWTDVTIPVGSGTVGAAIVTITPGGTTDAVTVTLPTGGAPVLFARLKVTQP